MLSVNGSAANVVVTITGSNGGFFRVNADGSLDFDANGEFEGLAFGSTQKTSVTYAISDGQGGTDTATAEVTVHGEVNENAPTTVLYQTISGQLYLFDTVVKEYKAVGDPFRFNVNAVGCNTEDDQMYAIVSSSTGTDSDGVAVIQNDIMRIDTDGTIHLIGDSGFDNDPALSKSYLGELDGDGNLWVMHANTNWLGKIYIDDITGDVMANETIRISSDFKGQIADFAYVPSKNAFFAVSAAKGKYGSDVVIKIDPFNNDANGYATVTATPITHTIYGDEVLAQFPSGTYGAVTTDAYGYLYVGLKNGNHDMDGSTANTGAIFRIQNFVYGPAMATLLSDAAVTRNNDAAMNPEGVIDLGVAPVATNDEFATNDSVILTITPMSDDTDADGDNIVIGNIDTTGLIGGAVLNEDGTIT